MKYKKIIVYVIILFVLILPFMFIKDNKRIFYDVYSIEVNYTSENGIVEKELDYRKTQKLIKVIHNVNTKEIIINQKKGWQILLKCFDQNHKYMYNVFVFNDILQVKDKTYRLENKAIEQIEKIIKE